MTYTETKAESIVKDKDETPKIFTHPKPKAKPKASIKVHIFDGLKHKIVEAEITQHNNRNNINVKLSDGTIINNVLSKKTLAHNFTHCNYF